MTILRYSLLNKKINSGHNHARKIDDSSFLGLLSCTLCKKYKPKWEAVHYELYYTRNLNLGKICFMERVFCTTYL